MPDLSKCVNLKSLSCSNNQLIKLPDLSNCVNFKELYCDDNQLTELPDLSKCINLKSLSCKNNQLTELPRDLPISVINHNLNNNPFIYYYDYYDYYDSNVTIESINKITRIIKNFRELYYSLKFARRIFQKVDYKRAMKEMHPDNLLNYLDSHPENDLEMNIDNFYSEKMRKGVKKSIV